MQKFYCHKSELNNEHVKMRCVDFKVPIQEAISSDFTEFINSFTLYDILGAMRNVQIGVLINGNIKQRIEAQAKLHTIDELMRNLDLT